MSNLEDHVRTGTMDLSHLTRPSVLCQCARCSSSLAACENEWAKLSNTYSTLAGWVSLDMNRISVSPEKKQIPQSSELSWVRGCVVQEIMCRLCHHKLGALVHFETGAKIFWKLSKLSFREIISMRETHPRFKEGSLPSLLSPQSGSAPDSSLALEKSEVAMNTSSVQQQIHNQGVSLNRISSSVGELHDTMTDLKQAFADLRIGLNTPASRGQDLERADGGMDMLKIVLKELQMKSDEIEKLRLENESLNLKNRMLTDRGLRDSSATAPPYLLESRLMPEVRSPGLNEHGKRGWPEAITDDHHKRQHQIADSFDEYDIDLMDDAEGEASSLPPMKIPLKPADRSASPPRLLQNGYDDRSEKVSRIRRDSGEPIVKRPRLAPENPGGAVKERRRPGRPRKSQTSVSNEPQPQTPVSVFSLSQRDSAVVGSTERPREESQVTNEDEIGSSGGTTQARGRARRARSKAPSRAASRAASRAPSVSPMVTRGAALKVQSTQDHRENTAAAQTGATNGELIEVSANVDGVGAGTKTAADSSQKPEEKENMPGAGATVPVEDVVENNKRKSQAAARDLLAKLTMEREEALVDLQR